MASSYPGATPSFTTKQDQIDVNYAAHVNRLQDEVRAIAVELGPHPRGTAASVRARLDAIDTQKANSTHNHNDLYWGRSIITSKGELLVGTSASNVAALAAAANGRVLTTDSSTPTGLRWATQRHAVVAALGSVTGTVVLNAATVPIFRATLAGNVTFDLQGASASANESTRITAVLTQDATGGWTMTWPASVVWLTAPPAAGAAGTVDLVELLTVNNGTTWFGRAWGN